MQIQIFTIPIMGGEKLLEEMNAFLRSKKVLRITERLVQENDGSCWCYSIRYIEDGKGKDKLGKTRKKIDYREVLDELNVGKVSLSRKASQCLCE